MGIEKGTVSFLKHCRAAVIIHEGNGGSRRVRGDSMWETPVRLNTLEHFWNIRKDRELRVL